jgi:hypothetical protein
MFVQHIEGNFLAIIDSAYIVDTGLNPITCQLPNIFEVKSGDSFWVLNRGMQYITYFGNCLINYQQNYINGKPMQSDFFVTDGTQWFVF